MSTVERKEYQETRIMRSKSPTTRSHQNFDSNLDNLLEDLQNSVSRPGSSLGHHNQNSSSNYKETSKYYSTNSSDGYGKTNSLNRIVNVKPSANPITEYSSDDAYTYNSPDGRGKVHTYKKEKYMYGKNVVERDVEPERSRMQNSINQLDSLLDDLQQVKKSSYSEKEVYNSSRTGTDPGFQTSTKSVNRELHYDDTPSPSTKKTYERMEEKSSYKKDLGYSSDGTYGDLRPISPSPSSKTSTLTKQSKVRNVHEYPIRVVETPVPDIDPEVLAHLDPTLHPPGNTKVTTTIKTYTYEIPGAGNYPTQIREDATINEEEYLDKMDNKYVYSPNATTSIPSKSFTYNKMENKENYYNHQQEPSSSLKKSYQEMVKEDSYRRPTSPSGGRTTVKEEEITTIRNYQPGYQPEVHPPTRNQTYVYNESTVSKNIENSYPPPPKTTQEIREYFINKETNVINKNQPPMSERGYPVYNPPAPEKKSYVLKETTHTSTNNNNNNNNNNNYQNGHLLPKDVETFPPQSSPHHHKKPNQQQEPINIQYSYKSTNSSENRYKGGYSRNEESQTLLPPKFPTNNDGIDAPPKKIDELMASIGHEPPNSPLNAGFNAHEKEVAYKKVVETLKHQTSAASETEDLQKKEIPTKNVTGPPVYYPPGHDMFAKKEEGGGGGAWRAQGEYAKGSEKYMYGAESGAKSKSKKGMAVVPVCLPLCCGLPCTII